MLPWNEGIFLYYHNAVIKINKSGSFYTNNIQMPFIMFSSFYSIISELSEIEI